MESVRSSNIVYLGGGFESVLASVKHRLTQQTHPLFSLFFVLLTNAQN